MWCDRATDGLELELWSDCNTPVLEISRSVRSETWYLPQVICNVTFSADTGAHKTLHFGEAQIINVSFNEPVFIWTRDCEKGIVHKLHYDILAFTFNLSLAIELKTWGHLQFGRGWGLSYPTQGSNKQIIPFYIYWQLIFKCLLRNLWTAPDSEVPKMFSAVCRLAAEWRTDHHGGRQLAWKRLNWRLNSLVVTFYQRHHVLEKSPHNEEEKRAEASAFVISGPHLVEH